MAPSRGVGCLPQPHVIKKKIAVKHSDSLIGRFIFTVKCILESICVGNFFWRHKFDSRRVIVIELGIPTIRISQSILVDTIIPCVGFYVAWNAGNIIQVACCVFFYDYINFYVPIEIRR